MPIKYLGIGLLLLIGLPTYAQLSVSGKVESSAEEALPFVHVTNVSQQLVAVSDAHGFFTVEAALQDTLRFSLVGYQPGQMIVRAEYFHQTQRIVLIEDSILLPGIVVFDRSIEPIITAPPRQSMSVSGVRGKEDIVQKKIIRFDPGISADTPGGVPVIGVGGSFTGVLTYLYERFSKDGKERRKYAETLRQKQKEAAYRELINDEQTSQQLKSEFQLSEPEYERLLTAFNEEYPDAKELASKSELMGLLYYFFSQRR